MGFVSSRSGEHDMIKLESGKAKQGVLQLSGLLHPSYLKFWNSTFIQSLPSWKGRAPSRKWVIAGWASPRSAQEGETDQKMQKMCGWQGKRQFCSYLVRKFAGFSAHKFCQEVSNSQPFTWKPFLLSEKQQAQGRVTCSMSRVYTPKLTTELQCLHLPGKQPLTRQARISWPPLMRGSA